MRLDLPVAEAHAAGHGKGDRLRRTRLGAAGEAHRAVLDDGAHAAADVELVRAVVGEAQDLRGPGRRHRLPGEPREHEPGERGRLAAQRRQLGRGAESLERVVDGRLEHSSSSRRRRAVSAMLRSAAGFSSRSCGITSCLTRARA